METFMDKTDTWQLLWIEWIRARDLQLERRKLLSKQAAWMIDLNLIEHNSQELCQLVQLEESFSQEIATE